MMCTASMLLTIGLLFGMARPSVAQPSIPSGQPEIVYSSKNLAISVEDVDSRYSESDDAENQIMPEMVQMETSKSNSSRFASELKKLGTSTGVGLLSGLIFGGLSYFTYAPNEAMKQNGGYGDAGRDFVSPVSWFFDLTKPLGKLFFGFNDTTFGMAAVASLGSKYDCFNLQKIVPLESKRKLALSYTVYNVVDGAIIGFAAGFAVYSLKIIYQHFKNRAQNEVLHRDSAEGSKGQKTIQKYQGNHSSKAQQIISGI